MGPLATPQASSLTPPIARLGLQNPPPGGLIGRRRSSSPDSSIQDGLAPGRRLTRDERIASQLGITGSDFQRVITMPMDEFQDFGHQRQFSEEQMSTLRDVRRRGKNKVAAQNCRKRKIDQIEELRDSVDVAR